MLHNLQFGLVTNRLCCKHAGPIGHARDQMRLALTGAAALSVMRAEPEKCLARHAPLCFARSAAYSCRCLAFAGSAACGQPAAAA